MDETQQVIIDFNAALNGRDLDGMMCLMTPDCVYENTAPPPEGTRYVGQAAVRAFWDHFFKGSQESVVETEELVVLGDRAVMRWRYRWVDLNGKAGHIRGVDVYRIENGRIAEKLSYVKG